MPNATMRKNHDKPARAASAAAQKEREEIIDALLRGLDALSSMAEGAGMGTAMRIFYTAKEELIHWAVNMNFHESAQDRFINRRLYDNRLSTVEALIVRAIRGSDVRGEMLGLLGLPLHKSRSAATRK